jgi:hypothetical protein
MMNMMEADPTADSAPVTTGVTDSVICCVFEKKYEGSNDDMPSL